MKKNKRKRRVNLVHRKRKYLLISLLVVFVFLGFGYSYLNKELNILGSLTVKEYYAPTLYNVLRKEAEINGLAREYTGAHQDSMNASLSTEKIYHWYATTDAEGTQILDKNNVVFADQCWQMIRTTDTGGVKMIYNGEVEDGKCLNTRGNHIGYAARTSQNLASNYWYGTDYIYDSSNKTFKVSGTTEQATWNETTGAGLVGKYTCKQTIESGTCTTLYFVESYYSASTAYVIPLNSSSNYSQFGTLQYNANSTSPADVGYMYNTRYECNLKTMTSSESILYQPQINLNYYYGDDVIVSNNKYELVNPFKISSLDEAQNIIGKYTLRATTLTSSNVATYISNVNSNIMYVIDLSSGNFLPDFNYTYTYGENYIDNGDGTYTINNPTTIRRSDWYTSYSNVGAYGYVCKNAVNDTCGELWYVTATSNASMNYIKVGDNYKYSKGFTWDGSKYVLDNDTSVSFWNINDSMNKANLNNAHYACWNETGECTSVSYIYMLSGTVLYYINLTGGKSVEDALSEMFENDNVNQIDSTMKKGIDAWYEKYLIEYGTYLEDVIYCNDRSFISLGGWNPDGGSITASLRFKNNNINGDLICTKELNQFSTNNNKAKLTYPVGLMTSSEIYLLNRNTAQVTGESFWLASPNYFNGNDASGRFISSNGNWDYRGVSSTFGVRPAVSLVAGTEYSSGDGSMANPYVVKMN